MRDQEGNVRIEKITRIKIDDKLLHKCNEQEITKEILALCSRIDQLRTQVEELQKAAK